MLYCWPQIERRCDAETSSGKAKFITRFKENESDMAKSTTNKSQIYIIHAKKTRFIKVGTSNEPSKRLRGVQTGNMYKLAVVNQFDGTAQDEVAIHRLFRAYRKEGEWFELPRNTSPVLAAELARFCTAARHRFQVATYCSFGVLRLKVTQMGTKKEVGVGAVGYDREDQLCWLIQRPWVESKSRYINLPTMMAQGANLFGVPYVLSSCPPLTGGWIHWAALACAVASVVTAWLWLRDSSLTKAQWWILKAFQCFCALQTGYCLARMVIWLQYGKQ